jgi:RHS repeat-associated protein
MDTTPESRATKYTLDSYGRITKIAPQGTTPSCVYPISITYGGSGYDNNQVTEIDQESDATSCTGSDSTRTTTIGHATSGATKGFINQVVTPTMTTTYTPDDDGRMTGIGLPGSRSITLGYDDDGALTAVTPPLGSSYKHQFVENSLDLLGTYEPPALSGYVNTTYTYDLDGLLIGTHPPTANVVTYTRDSAGRVSGVSYNDPVSGTITVTMSYDATTGHACTSGCTASNGSSTGLDPGTTTTDAYDGDLMTSETTAFTSPTASHTVDWGYDDHLRLQTRDIDAESFTSTTLGYDQDDNIASATVDGPSTMYVYRGSTGLISCTNLTNICEVYTYNAFGELKEQKAVNGSCTSSCSPSGTTLLDIQYGHNSDGRIDTKNEVIGLSSCDWTYAYNAEDYTTNTNLYPEYLYTAARSGGTNCGALSYTSKYDADGNIKGTADFYGSFASTFNAQDQLTYDGYWSYAYDAQGNVRSQSAYGEYSYMYYDPLGNLREGVNYPSSTYGFDIDVKNRRVGRVAGGSFIGGYVYDGDRVIAELDSSGALKSYFVYVTKANVPDIMVASDGTVYRMLSDQIGSVRRVINVSTGASIENLSFDPYGLTVSWPNATAIWPTVQPFGFAGGIWDSTTALYRFGARDYSPFKGSWWSKDPILVNGGLNLYRYCNADPINCVDPSGHGPEALAGLAEPAILGIDAIIAADCVLYGCDNTLVPLYNHFFPQGKPANDNGTPCDPASDAAGDDKSDDCELQYTNDLSTCRSLGRRSKKKAALCYASALERLNACKAGQPLPPLQGWW